MVNIKKFYMASFVVPLFLAACSGGPSDTDIKSAMENQMGQIKNMSGVDLQAGAKFDVKNTKCSSVENNNYKCTYEFTIQTVAGSHNQVLTSVFAKTDNGWQEVGQ